MIKKIIKKAKKIKIFFLYIFFVKNKKGIQKKVIENKLREYAPNNDNTCVISDDHNQVYETKFQGNPVNKFPLKNSNIEKISEKKRTKDIFLSQNEPTTTRAKPKNIDKNNGMTISAIGIKSTNISS